MMDKTLYVFVFVIASLQVVAGAAIHADNYDDLMANLQRYHVGDAESSDTRYSTHQRNNEIDADIELLARLLFKESSKRKTVNALRRSWNIGDLDTGVRATHSTSTSTTVKTTVPITTTSTTTPAPTSGQTALKKWLLQLLGKYWWG